ncbi:MAG: hypothetical protein WBX81_17725 [Nitrososphaeraceae archaeon]
MQGGFIETQGVAVDIGICCRCPVADVAEDKGSKIAVRTKV